MNDLKIAVRALRKNPGFTLIVVFILALGIGGTTAIFSAVRAVLLRPLAFPEPDQLVRAFNVTRGHRGTVSPPARSSGQTISRRGRSPLPPCLTTTSRISRASSDLPRGARYPPALSSRPARSIGRSSSPAARWSP